MSVASERGTSSRGGNRSRSSSNGKSGASGAKASGRGRQAASSRQKSSSRSTRQTQAKSQKSRPAQKSSGTQKQSQSAEQSPARSENSGGSRGAISNVLIPVATATIGVAGGVLLGRSARQKTRKVLGIPVPINVDFGDVTSQIGQAGKQLGKLASEVQAVREKAEQIGKAVG